MGKSNIELMVAMSGVYRTRGTDAIKQKRCNADGSAAGPPVRRRQKLKATRIAKDCAFVDVKGVVKSIVKRAPKAHIGERLKSAFKSVGRKDESKEKPKVTFRINAPDSATNITAAPQKVTIGRSAGGAARGPSRPQEQPKEEAKIAVKEPVKRVRNKVVSSGYGQSRGTKFPPLKSVLRQRPVTACDLMRKPGSDIFNPPKSTMDRFANLRWPRDPSTLGQLLRPQIYVDLELKGVQPLGRIVVQLFTEACPDVVLELVRVCKAQQKDKLQFVRMLPSLWLEAHLDMAVKELFDPNTIKYDMSVLDHGQSGGVLSFATSTLAHNLRLGVLSFTISFQPHSPFNGSRVAFGRVRRGQNLLDTLQKYGMTCGTTFRQIMVEGIGVL